MSHVDVPPLDPVDLTDDHDERDPRRWITLMIVIVAAFIITLDNTVLNVAIPTILRDFDTSLPNVEWVITGYALTFATFLIIGGRLGDIYGHRRIFMIGTALFGLGSLIAALSQGVPELLLGEAVIEGIGASFMLPSTLAILSATFHGRERATAFAAWGATAGVAVAMGPLVGGFLTTNYSWRWSFGINVIIAPLALLGAWFFMRPTARTGRRIKIDLPGAAMVASGMFWLVFSLSEGSRYGWWKPIAEFEIGGHVLWSASSAISIIPATFALAVVILSAFYFYERWKERHDDDPLVEFVYLKLRTYRYGLLTGLLISMSQLGLTFVLAQYLQTAEQLSAEANGLWMLPTGVFVIIGAQIGGCLTRRLGPTIVVRAGLILYALGVLWILRVVGLDTTVWNLAPGLALWGLGIGFSLAQLNNLILSEIPKEVSGVASGANTTCRQVGMALGVAVIGALLTTTTITHASAQIDRSGLPAIDKVRATAGVNTLGINYTPPASAGRATNAVVTRALESGVVAGTRWALTFVLIVIIIGGLFAFRIPNIHQRSAELLLANDEAAKTFDGTDERAGIQDRELSPSAFSRNRSLESIYR